MKIVLFILLLSWSLCVIGQSSEWVTRDLINLPLTFLTHKDSIPNLYIIKNGKAFNGTDSISLIDSLSGYNEYRRFYKDKIKTYLIWTDNNFDGLYITLAFIDNRLFCISIFATNHFYISNIKMNIEMQFKEKQLDGWTTSTIDSTVDRGNTITNYGTHYTSHSMSARTKKIGMTYYEDIINTFASYSLYDQGVHIRIPSWWSVGSHTQTWEKLAEYMEKRNAKEIKRK